MYVALWVETWKLHSDVSGETTGRWIH